MHVQLVSIILGNFFLESIILKFSYSSIIQHEMMHALGLFHMQSRPDRDSYVKINSENIRSGTEGNFEKCDTCLTYEVGYDARSFMHYHSTAFSTNGQPTIESIVSQLIHLAIDYEVCNCCFAFQTDEFTTADLGSSTVLTSNDILLLRRMYGCGKSIYGKL